MDNVKAVDILREIKKGKTHRLYLLFGSNGTYLKENIVTSLSDLLIDQKTGAFDYALYYGKNLSSNELSHFLNSPPFGKAKLIVVKDAGQIKKTELKKILSFQIPEFSTLVIISEADMKVTTSEKDAVSINSYSITRTMIKSWIKSKAKENGKKISDEAIAELITRLDSDLFLLSSEIRKLSLFAGENKSITEEDVSKVVKFIPEIGVFPLIDAIVSGKKSTALKMYKDFLNSQDSVPQQLLSLLLKTFMQMALIKELTAQGVNKNDIAGKAGIYPTFLVNKLIPTVQKLKYKDIVNKFHLLNEIDVKSKNGEVNLPLAISLFIEKS